MTKMKLNPFFPITNAQLVPWKKVAKILDTFESLIFLNTQSKHLPNRRKFAQSGRPGCNGPLQPFRMGQSPCATRPGLPDGLF
jgi:hypothetical protein